MEIRKNNDIKFQIHFVDNAGNQITDVKDVKCTIVNFGLSAFRWNMHQTCNKMLHSVMCGYDHTYNVFPVNSSAYYKQFVKEECKNPGIHQLPVRFYPQSATAEAYFAATDQKATGKYNMTIELQCWDPSWADKGYHTHTVQVDNVVTLTSGENIASMSPCVVELTVVLPHSEKRVPNIMINVGSSSAEATQTGFEIPVDFYEQGTSIDFTMRYDGETVSRVATFFDDEGSRYISARFFDEFDGRIEALEFDRTSSGNIKATLRGASAEETPAVITIHKIVVNGTIIYP